MTVAIRTRTVAIRTRTVGVHFATIGQIVTATARGWAVR